VLAAGWDSLEVAKLAVAALTPLVVLGLGVIVSRAARRVEDAQWSNRKLVERRLDLYDRMAGPLNDLFCFFRLVGHFRDLDPPSVIQRKRELDKTFYVNRFLMSDDFADLYHAYINTCFRPWETAAHDAKLRMSASAQRFERGTSAPWKPEWNDLFVTEADEMASKGVVRQGYEGLMKRFAAECGVQSPGEVGEAPGSHVDARTEKPS
jgi:hypothetical protein